jgi:protein tyrosine/serine phosphatase
MNALLTVTLPESTLQATHYFRFRTDTFRRRKKWLGNELNYKKGKKFRHFAKGERMKNPLRSSLLTLIAVLTFAVIGTAQTSPKAVDGINIKNFGQMDDILFRGGQPAESDYKALAAFGIHTIVDLRNDEESFAKSAAEAAGMKYVNIPMDGVSAPSDQDVATFLSVVNDPTSGKIFMHCKAGIHRTGAMGAVYRIAKDHWDYDKTYLEMKNYEFSAGLFHGALKSFVKKYSDKAAASAPVVATKVVAATEN